MYRACIKRLCDILLSFVGLIILVPVFCVVAPIIYLTDKGPIFFNGERLGHNGKIFKMYKFRSMYVNAPDLRNEDGSTYNSDEDPRVTPIGKFMRKTSIDELPQFINVLIGDMSLVGPRPGLPDREWYDENIGEQRRRKVRPGITGYSQALFRNSDTMEERMKNDIYYAENVSFILDVFVLFKTVQSVLGRKNIYRN